MRMVVLDADELRVLLERPLRREVLRVEVVGDDLRLDAEHLEVQREVGAEGAGGRARRSRSPRCGERNASAPRATQKVLFSSGPAATSGRRAATGSGRADGANPRERRTREAARARPSPRSGGGSAGRATRNASAIPPSRSRASASSNAIGSSERLPLVITSGPPKSAQQQVVERRVREHDPEPRGSRRDRRRDGASGAARAAGRSAARATRAGRALLRRDVGERVRARPSSPRTACPRGACAHAAARRPPRSPRRRRGGSRRAP